MNAQDALVDIGYTVREARQVMPSLFLYLFRAFNQSELYRRSLEINPNVNLFKLMPRIPLMGEITLHDKVCLFALFQGEDPGIKPNPYVKTVLLKDAELLAHLEQFRDFPAYDVATVTSLEARALMNNEIKAYIGKFIFRKMRFILKSYGVDKDELEGSLQERAIHNLRVNYPNWKTSGDMLAMVKSAVANAGHNLIKYYAATKRAKVDGENHAVEYSLESMQEMSGDAPEYQAMIYSSAFDRAIEVMEATRGVESILENLKQANLNGKRLLISILSGRFDLGFTEYLGKDCCEFAENSEFGPLLEAACGYMELEVPKAQKFLTSLGTTKVH
jgi:hypothetical protein